MKLSDFLVLQPKQQLALQTLFNPQCKYLLYGGSMGSGKSFVLRWAAVLYLIFLWQKYKIEGIQVGLFSEDYPTLKDRQISRIEREFPPWLGKLKDDVIHGLSFMLGKENGEGIILLRNLDDPSKYMSTEFAGEFVEELTRNEEHTFQDLRNRLRYPAIDQVKFMGTSNPGGIGHAWVKRLFVDKASTDHEQSRFFYIPARVYDNKYISKEYVQQLEALPEQKRKAYLYGSWDVFEGQVFTEFTRDTHVIKQILPLKTMPHYLSFDWGYTAPFACYASAVIKMKAQDGQVFNRVVTYQEWYGTEKTEREWADTIYHNSLMPKFQDGYADASMFNRKTDGSISIANEFERRWDELHKSRWLTLKEGTKNRLSRVAAVHNWLSIAPDGLPYWLITENCINLIHTLPMLVYDDVKTEDVDTTQNDHAYDSVSYLLTQVKFIGAIGGIKRGQSMRTRMIDRVKRFKPMRATIITEGQTSDLLKAFENAKVQNRDWKTI